MSMDRFMAWLRGRMARPVDVDGYYGAQCTDLVNDYLKEVWGKPRLSGNAVDFARQGVSGFVWEANSAINHPPVGSIVVWGGPDPIAGTSAAGHTAVAVCSSSMVLLSFDQNWPTGHAPALTLHEYRAVLGWLRPAAMGR